MKPFYQDNHNTIYCLDFRKNELSDESVQMVCTSPPYWGLRKYSGEQELIWGDNHCEHQWATSLKKWHGDRGEKAKLERKEVYDDTFQVEGTPSGFCSLCGAWKGAFGLEPTPELYVQHTIEILREIRRVLRKDGVVFWNIGDSYNSKTSGYGEWTGEKARQGDGEQKKVGMTRIGINHPTIKPKDLCLIPFRVALEAQRDGWWVRAVIIWSKLNPMPESVKDRPTESHEYILMLTKSARYYWDQEAVREKYTEPMNRWGGETLKRDTSKTAEYKEMQKIGYSSAFRVGRPMRPDPSGRNIRSVWEFPTKPFPGAHFAVFPEKLPELCIKAATPEVGCCSKCGAPWERIIEKGFTSHDGESKTAYTDELGHNASQLAKLRQVARASGEEYVNTAKTLGWHPTCKCEITEQMKRAGCDSSGNYSGTDQKDYGEAKAQSPSETKKRILKSMGEPKITTGWKGTCDCEATPVPSVVLDPLMGAGTTLLVAKNLNRFAVGYELSEEYCQLAVERCRQQVLI